MNRGRFVTIEGVEGAGKSTQARRLAEALRAAGRTVTLTREPGGCPGAERIRELLLSTRRDGFLPLTEALLHYAARREHTDRVIVPALDGGSWVISDRFADSTMAYQSYGLGLGRPLVERLHDIVLGSLAPDLTLVLDLPSDSGLERAHGRGSGDDHYERLGADFHRRVREGFLDIARRAPERCVVIDAGSSVDAVQTAVQRAVAARLGVRL